MEGYIVRLKTYLRRKIPYSAIEIGRKIIYFGFTHSCSLCNAKLRKLNKQGYGYPVLEKLQVVGGMLKYQDRCPICHACDRERLIKYFLDKCNLKERDDKIKILHFAPEKSLSNYLLSWKNIDYHPVDIQPGRYIHLKTVKQMNLQKIDFLDNEIDLLICNHVLEHIVDDIKAMREAYRVLSPQGIAILQVPISLKLTKTIEGDGSESEEEKINLYGQSDHVRIYTENDYKERLRCVGFKINLYNAFEVDAKLSTTLNLNPFERLFICSK
jgi:predicted SAM-dependent methyltransferase